MRSWLQHECVLSEGTQVPFAEHPGNAPLPSDRKERQKDGRKTFPWESLGGALNRSEGFCDHELCNAYPSAQRSQAEFGNILETFNQRVCSHNVSQITAVGPKIVLHAGRRAN
jgi:hypothetical protein